MGTQMLKYFFAYLGLYLGIGLLICLMVLFSRNRLDAFLGANPLISSGVVALLVLLVSFMFFKFQDIFIVFPPPPGTPPLEKQELLSRLSAAFDRPVDGTRLFDVKVTDSRAIITWSSTISYFQGMSGGRTGKKRVVVLTLDEQRKVAYFIMKDKDWNWKLSSNYAEFSLNYATGLSAEFVTEAYPSIELGPRGLTVDIKRLTYSSNELFLPIQSAVLSSGWTLRGGMIPNPYHRLILCGSLSLFVFLLIAPLMRLGKPKTAGVAVSSTAQQAMPGKSPEEYRKEQVAANIKVLPLLTTEQIYLSGVKAFLTMPEKYFTAECADKFTAYAKAYLKRPDRSEENAAVIREFAAQRRIDLGE